MLIGPILIIYVGFEALESKSQILLGLLPISVGLISLYLWIHVKIYFDQLSKAKNRVAPSPKKSTEQSTNPVSITVMAPYPATFDAKNFNAGLIAPQAPVYKEM